MANMIQNAKDSINELLSAACEKAAEHPDSLVLGKHLIEPRQGLARLGKKNDAAHRTVEPMNHTEKDVAGLLILLLQISFHKIRQRDIAGLVSLHDVPCFLSDSNQMIVLVDNIDH